MSRVVVLDNGVIGLLIKPGLSPEGEACVRWLRRIQAAGVSVRIPLICYYESRREWQRLSLRDRGKKPTTARSAAGAIDRLEGMSRRFGLLPIDLRTMDLASRLWAEARTGGYPTAPNHSLDADVILAATAIRAARGGKEVTIVTTNDGHLARYAPACRWDAYPID